MPRGRKVNSNGEQSKQLLLEKAIELFSEKGYHATKISGIVAAANLTQPTFYLYFKSKDSLYNDLNKKFQVEFNTIMTAQFREATLEIEDFQKNLEHKLTRLFIYMSENPSLTKIGFFESAQARCIKANFADQIVKLIQYHQCEHFFQVCNIDLQIIVNGFVGSFERLVLTNLLSEKSQPHELARDLMCLYFPEKKRFE